MRMFASLSTEPESLRRRVDHLAQLFMGVASDVRRPRSTCSNVQAMRCIIKDRILISWVGTQRFGPGCRNWATRLLLVALAGSKSRIR